MIRHHVQTGRHQREAKEQAALFEWAALQRALLPGIDLMFAIPNGAFLQGGPAQRAAQWAKLKRQGARPGVSDVFLPVPRGSHAGLWIEMKAPKPHPSEVSAEQADWQQRMRGNGYAALICYGWTEAVAAIQHYYESEEK